MSTIKGILTNAGTMTVGTEENRTGLFIAMTEEELRAVPSLPMFREVKVCVASDRDQLRAEKAEAELHALRLVCGTTDANKFETALDREREKVRVMSGLLSRIYKNLAVGWLPAGLYEDLQAAILRANIAANEQPQPKTEGGK